MIEFIEKQTVLNKERFEPMLRVTVDISKEKMSSLMAKHGTNEALDIVGREFAKVLKDSN
jgi:hypothetical protein